MTNDPVELLVQEVEDLLPAGRVGLYEFMWILHSEKVEGSRDHHRQIARRALEELLRQDGSRLITLIWAQQDTEEDLQREVRDEDFEDQQLDIPYVAIAQE